MHFFIKASSKNKTSLQNFLIFISDFNFPLKLVANFPNKKKKKFLTVLKSPHVNKDAQDQFEFKYFSKNIIVYSNQPKLFLFVFKKILNTSFADLDIKLYSSINVFSDNQYITNNHLNPRIVKINFINFKKTNKNFVKLTNYLELCDCYGENLFFRN